MSSSFDCNVAHMGREEARTGFSWGNMRERDRLEHLDVHVKIILKWIFKT